MRTAIAISEERRIDGSYDGFSPHAHYFPQPPGAISGLASRTVPVAGVSELAMAITLKRVAIVTTAWDSPFAVQLQGGTVQSLHILPQ
jgi:hypothetical protein